MSEHPERTHPAASVWPPARIRVTTPRLQLRLPTEAEIAALAEVAARGIHAPDSMPFASPWSDEPPAVIAQRSYQWHMKVRGAWAPERWTLLLVAFVDGAPAGAQDVAASGFAVRREVGTASWLGREFQGAGLGTEMRHAALELAFGALGAQSATSGAYEDNAASQRVSEKCGYTADGREVVERSRGAGAPGGVSHARAIELRYRIEVGAWRQRRRDDIVVEGVDDDVLAIMGARADGPDGTL